MSKIEVNQISSQCGSTLTIGQSGDTIQLACGATQSGFGRTGTVDWDTTAKTASFTAVSGNGYFVNTTSGAVTMTLPATPSAGDIVSFKDYAYTFATNNLTVAPNGSNIGGDGAASIVYDLNGTSKTFIYVDGTQGWLVTNESTDTSSGENFVVATGGTITTCGDCKIHTFTSPGTFCVSQIAGCSANNEVSYMVVAGGGGGGSSWRSGGGGAGGFREDKSPVTPYTASPLDGAGPITVTATAFPITVGGGGTGGGPALACKGSNGSNSVFSTITSAGGGLAGEYNPSVPACTTGSPGGSGGGGGGDTNGPGIGGSGNTPPVSPPQGNNGGTGNPNPSGGCFQTGGGGGGAGVVGTPGEPPQGANAGNGGDGVQTSINGSATYYAGGGGGGCYSFPSFPTNATGGQGGGGAGGGYNPGPPEVYYGGENGTANTGGGGGGKSGSSTCNTSGSGGSGIVIIRYKYR